MNATTEAKPNGKRLDDQDLAAAERGGTIADVRCEQLNVRADEVRLVTIEGGVGFVRVGALGQIPRDWVTYEVPADEAKRLGTLIDRSQGGGASASRSSRPAKTAATTEAKPVAKSRSAKPAASRR